MNELTIVVDFDGTLMQQDVGNVIMKRLGVFEQPETIEAGVRFRNKEIGSMEWAKVAYSFLDGKQGLVDEVLQEITLRKGAERFLQFCREHELPVVILSDGMSYYIERLMEMHQIQVEQIVSNPITYLPDGSYQLKFQNNNDACGWCGCCKAGAVRQLRKEGGHFVYIGDGTSDYYGSGYADWVFARDTLADYLNRAEVPYYSFESFEDILEIMVPDLASFREGTAPKKSNRGHPFCRFAE